MLDDLHGMVRRPRHAGELTKLIMQWARAVRGKPERSMQLSLVSVILRGIKGGQGDP